jgi:hypothetical protein
MIKKTEETAKVHKGCRAIDKNTTKNIPFFKVFNSEVCHMKFKLVQLQL